MITYNVKGNGIFKFCSNNFNVFIAFNNNFLANVLSAAPKVIHTDTQTHNDTKRII